MAKQEIQGTVAERLKALGVGGVLIDMAKNGQILALRCEMPTCYCPNGRKNFEAWPDPQHASDANSPRTPTITRP